MWFFCLVHVLSFIICLYFLYTFINWHLNYFLYIIYVYNINLLIFCQCSNQPLIYPKIDIPGRENSKPLLLSSLPIFPSKYKPSLFLTFPVVFEIEEGAWEGLGMECLGGLGNGMLGRVTEAKKEAGPDEFLWNSSDSASCFLCSFSPGHLDGS